MNCSRQYKNDDVNFIRQHACAEKNCKPPGFQKNPGVFCMRFRLRSNLTEKTKFFSNIYAILLHFYAACDILSLEVDTNGVRIEFAGTVLPEKACR